MNITIDKSVENTALVKEVLDILNIAKEETKKNLSVIIKDIDESDGKFGTQVSVEFKTENGDPILRSKYWEFSEIFRDDPAIDFVATWSTGGDKDFPHEEGDCVSDSFISILWEGER